MDWLMKPRYYCYILFSGRHSRQQTCLLQYTVDYWYIMNVDEWEMHHSFKKKIYNCREE
jgi:hypothetical protein